MESQLDIESVLKMDYETQHFGFHPRLFFDKIYNAFHADIFEALNQMKIFLSEEYSGIVSADVIALQTESLFKHFIKKLDKAIDKLEIFVNKNLFHIPDHVVLKSDMVHVTEPCTKEEYDKLDQELEELKEKIIEKRVEKEYLKVTFAEQKEVLQTLFLFQQELQKLQDALKGIKFGKENAMESWTFACDLLKKFTLENRCNDSGIEE